MALCVLCTSQHLNCTSIGVHASRVIAAQAPANALLGGNLGYEQDLLLRISWALPFTAYAIVRRIELAPLL